MTIAFSEGRCKARHIGDLGDELGIIATEEQRDVFRARIVLIAGEGESTRSIARITLGWFPNQDISG